MCCDMFVMCCAVFCGYRVGRPSVTVWGNFLACCLVGYPLAFGLVFWTDLGLLGLWTAMSGAWAAASAVYFFVIFHWMDWQKEVAIAAERAAQAMSGGEVTEQLNMPLPTAEPLSAATIESAASATAPLSLAADSASSEPIAAATTALPALNSADEPSRASGARSPRGSTRDKRFAITAEEEDPDSTVR